MTSTARDLGRWTLAGLLLAAGVGHLVATDVFLAQTPTWLPARTAIVIGSGVIELGLGAALLALPRHRVVVGWVVAAWFVIVFPGNVNQAVTGTSAFGLDTSTGRWIRLLFQPALVVWALWATSAWRAWRVERRATGR